MLVIKIVSRRKGNTALLWTRRLLLNQVQASFLQDSLKTLRVLAINFPFYQKIHWVWRHMPLIPALRKQRLVDL